MNPFVRRLLARLEELAQERAAAANPPQRFVVGLSGGLDSTVLTHALAEGRRQHGRALAALHVDHGLHPDSAAWARQCQAFCERLDVTFEALTVSVDDTLPGGPEARAREARYAALAARLRPGDWLLSAHHRDDQAETLLINLLRGSGPAGVAGIPALRPLGRHLLARPLLDVGRADLEAYARAAELDWLEDPANASERFDRNFIRHELLPLLQTRWPEASKTLARSARLAREAAGLLDELADLDLARAWVTDGRLDCTVLAELSRPRQANALRRALAACGLPPASSAQLDVLIDELLNARADAMPLLAWEGAEVRRYRDHLYLIAAAPVAAFAGERLVPEAPLDLGPGLGRLRLEPGPGIAAELATAGLCLRLREGGEKIKPVGHTHTRQLKKLLQEEGVVPWLRDRLPLVYAGERLVAVADLWVAADAAAEEGFRLCWEGRPALH